MDNIDLEKEIGRGKELYSETVRVMSDFLERFPDLEPAEISGFEQRRQALLEAILTFHAGLRQKLAVEGNSLPLAMTQKLDEFRIYQEVFVQIVKEKDAAIIARANQSLVGLQGELAAIGRGRLALRGYARKRGLSPNYLDKTG